MALTIRRMYRIYEEGRGYSETVGYALTQDLAKALLKQEYRYNDVVEEALCRITLGARNGTRWVFHLEPCDLVVEE